MNPKPRYISQYLDLVWEDDQPRIYVAGKRFLACSFLVTNTKVTEEMIASRFAGPPGEENKTIEDLLEEPGSRSLEGIDAVKEGLLEPEEMMFGFASSLEGFVKHGYNSYTIGANLAFPLLKELARAGDPKAKRVLNWEIESRLKTGAVNTAVVIIDTCYDVMTTEAWLVVIQILQDTKKPARWMLADKIAQAFEWLPDRVIEAFIQANLDIGQYLPLINVIATISFEDRCRAKCVKWGRRLIEVLGVLPRTFVIDGHDALVEIVAEHVLLPGFVPKYRSVAEDGPFMAGKVVMNNLSRELNNPRLLNRILDFVIKTPIPGVLDKLTCNRHSTIEMLTRIAQRAEKMTGTEKVEIYTHLAENRKARGVITLNHDPKPVNDNKRERLFTVDHGSGNYPFELRYTIRSVPYGSIYFKQDPITIFNLEKQMMVNIQAR